VFTDGVIHLSTGGGTILRCIRAAVTAVKILTIDLSAYCMHTSFYNLMYLHFLLKV
jgi:hypothetical protein